MKKLFLALLLLLISYGPADAAIKYINNASGCPGNGSSGSPYCTIAGALATAAAGDDFRIRGTSNQVYSELVSITGKNGTAGSPIILQADTGASFLIRNAGGPTFNASIKVKESDYWQYRNLVFDGAGVNPTWVALQHQCETKHCTGIVVDGNTFKNWTTTSVDWYPVVLYVAGCHVSLGCSQTFKTSATITNNTFLDLEGVAINLLATDNTTVRGNDISGLRCAKGTSGGDRWGAVYVSYDNTNLLIEKNNIHDFQATSSCTKTLTGFPVMFGYWCDVGGQSTTLRKNRIYNLNSTGGGIAGSTLATGIFVEAGCDGHTVERNEISAVTGGLGVALLNSKHSLTGTRNKYYHNTIHASTYGLANKEGFADFKNNIVSNPVSAAVCLGCWSGAPNLTNTLFDNNLYELAGSVLAEVGGGVGNRTLAQWRTYCSCDANSTTEEPAFTAEGSQNFTLTSTSPAINTGANLGFAYNGSAPDRGAHETILFSIGEVGLVNSTTAVLTFTNNVNPPLLPASSCTGFTVQEFIAAVWTSKTLSSCTRTADGQITLVFTVGVTGGNSLRISYSGGNVTDSALIGNANNQPLFTITNQSITNNVSGSPSHVFDFTHFQFYELRKIDGSLVKLPQPAAAVNTAISLAKGASLVLDIQVNCENVADCPASAALARYNRNGSGFSVIVPDTVGADGISMLGQTATGSDVPMNAETVTGCLVAGGRTEFDGQTVVVANAVPTFNLTQNSCIRLRFVFDFAATVEPGDTYDILPYNQDNTQLTATPTVTPRITIRAPRSGSGF